jgi:hypothetical protein
MLPPNCFMPWGPGALYAELYLGLCRALAAPWLCPPRVDPARAAPACAPAPCRSPSELAAAESSAAEPAFASPTGDATETTPGSEYPGASIIPFDRARARLSRRPPR